MRLKDTMLIQKISFEHHFVHPSIDMNLLAINSAVKVQHIHSEFPMALAECN